MLTSNSDNRAYCIRLSVLLKLLIKWYKFCWVCSFEPQHKHGFVEFVVIKTLKF